MNCPDCLKLGYYIGERYALPNYPPDVQYDPLHPLHDAWKWDYEFMRQMGWQWDQYYGALQEIRHGHNPFTCTVGVDYFEFAPVVYTFGAQKSVDLCFTCEQGPCVCEGKQDNIYWQGTGNTIATGAMKSSIKLIKKHG